MSHLAAGKTIGKPWENGGLPSGNLLQFAIENGPVEIVDLPIENGGSFQFAILT